MTRRPVIVIGAGGHGRVVADALLASGREVRGFTDRGLEPGTPVLGTHVLGDDRALDEFDADMIDLAMGLGSVERSPLRAEVFDRLSARFRFTSVVHPSAVVSTGATIGTGSQVMAGAVVQTGVRIGKNVLLNTRSSLDHDCDIGDHAHIAPGVTLSGGVFVGARTHIGTGSVAIQSVRIGSECMIGAGSTVFKDLPDGRALVQRRSHLSNGKNDDRSS